MPNLSLTENTIITILFQSLDEDRYDLDAIRSELSAESHLVNDIKIDSLDLLDFLLRLKAQFGVEVGKDRRAELMTIKAIAQFVDEQNA